MNSPQSPPEASTSIGQPPGSPARFKWARIADLTALEMHAILVVRQQVFVVEQSCIFQDADELDLACWHVQCLVDGVLSAYLRVVDAGQKFAELSIGRVLTNPDFRGQGLGQQLMQEAVSGIQSRWPGQAVRISAQAYLLDFYSRFGFEVVSDEYLEDGILHVDMLRRA